MEKLQELYRYLHAHPELSGQEAQTALYLEATLREVGYQPVRIGKYGVYADLVAEENLPWVLFRSDMDALAVTEETEVSYISQNPGVMHACGHDVHTTVQLGAAAVLKELAPRLKGKVKLYAVTNGVTTTQTPRLEKSGLLPYFDGVFISEQMGCKKPEAEFFDKVFAAIGVSDRSRTVILGDSLTSDMQGGRNAGIKTCYFGTDPDDRCDFSITDLTQFPSILGM